MSSSCRGAGSCDLDRVVPHTCQMCGTKLSVEGRGGARSTEVDLAERGLAEGVDERSRFAQGHLNAVAAPHHDVQLLPGAAASWPTSAIVRAPESRTAAISAVLCWMAEPRVRMSEPCRVGRAGQAPVPAPNVLAGVLLHEVLTLRESAQSVGDRHYLSTLWTTQHPPSTRTPSTARAARPLQSSDGSTCCSSGPAVATARRRNGSSAPALAVARAPCGTPRACSIPASASVRSRTPTCLPT